MISFKLRRSTRRLLLLAANVPVVTLILALQPAVVFLYTMHRLASTHYRLAGSVAVLSAFSIGALWLRLHEANDSVAHVIGWHYLPMLGAGLLGLWLGKRLLKW